MNVKHVLPSVILDIKVRLLMDQQSGLDFVLHATGNGALNCIKVQKTEK